MKVSKINIILFFVGMFIVLFCLFICSNFALAYDVNDNLQTVSINSDVATEQYVNDNILPKAPDSLKENNKNAKDITPSNKNQKSQLPPSQMPAPIKNGCYAISSSVSWCRVLDVPFSSKSTSTPMNIYQYNNTDAQYFYFTLGEDNYYTITSLTSGLALDVLLSQAKSGITVQQYTPNNTPAQKWQIYAEGDGYCIKSALGDYVLDVNLSGDYDQNKVNIYSPNKSSAQIWHFTEKGKDIKFADNLLSDGEYVISPKVAQTRALDVAHSSLDSGGNIQIYEGNRSDAQTFIFSHDVNGYYTIKNKNSGKVADLSSSNTNNYTNIQQYDSNNTYAQKWVVIKNLDGTYTIHSSLKKNLVFDVLSSKDADWTNVQAYESNRTNAQKWSFYNPQPGQVIKGKRLLENDWYNIVEPNTGYVIDVPSCSRDEYTQVQVYKKNNTLAQAFYFEWSSGTDDEGYYRIKCGCGRHLALAVKNASILPGSSIVTEDYDSEDTLWALVENGTKRYLVNKSSGLYLSLESSSIKVGTKAVGLNQQQSSIWSFCQTAYFSEGIYTISSSISSNVVVDVPACSRKPDMQLQIYNLNNSLAQKWKAKKCDTNTFAFQCIGTGLWLGVNGGYAVQKTTEENSKPSSDLYWKVEIVNGCYLLTNISTNKVLDLNRGDTTPGNKILAYTRNESDAQLWNLVSTLILSDGYYTIHPKQNNSKCFDVNGSSFWNGAQVQSYSVNRSGGQSFHIINNSDGTVSFRNARSKKCIDIPGSSAVEGRSLQQYDQNNSAAQKWKIELTDDCYFVIKSSLNTNFVIDSGNSADYEILKLNGFNKSKTSQEFTFSLSDYEDIYWSNNCPFIPQYPELPWGCESVALTELLWGMGYGIDKTLIAAAYIPYSSWDFVNCYAGSPWNPPSGIGCTMPPCISNSCNNFLSAYGSRFRSNVATGMDFSEILVRAQCGYPSVVWTTIDMLPVSKYGQVLYGYQVYTNLHAVCVCGYDGASNSVIVCDSISGKVARPRAAFESIYNQAGRYAVTID